MSFIYRDYINANHEPDNQFNYDLEDLKSIAKDITKKHIKDMTVNQRIDLFHTLAEDFKNDDFDEDDKSIFDTILLFAEEELFPKTQLCDMCDCRDHMCICAPKCPIYRKFYK